MKNTLILHGWWLDSKENWFPWLSSEIEFKADEVYVPNLPNTFKPILEEQLDYLWVYSDFLSGWNIVAYSLWCQLALKFIEENNIKNSKLILGGSVKLSSLVKI